MQRLVLVIGWLALSGGPIAAQCCGDCDGNGVVSIDELIVGVNHALDGCLAVTPTPTASTTPTPQNTATSTLRPTPTVTALPSCGSTFANTGTNPCVFNGRFNLGCGNSLLSAFRSDGQTLIVQVDTQLASPPSVLFGAVITSSTTASLTAWSSDNFSTTHPTAGSIQLANSGRQLVIFPNNPPFMILSCNFVQYNGTFVAATVTRQTRAQGFDEPDPTVFDRLRAWQHGAPPELAD